MKQLKLDGESVENDELPYTDEIKNTLDKRYNEYKNGIDLISPSESHRKIYKLLASN